MLRLFSLILLFTCAFFLTCKKDTTPRFPDEQKSLADVYVDLLLLQDRISTKDPAFLDSTRKILRAHHFTQEKYENAVAFFNKDPELWEAFYHEVKERLNQTESSPASPLNPSIHNQTDPQ
jgi:hypothetical protein